MPEGRQPYRLFLSHSLSPWELGIIYAVAEEAAKRGIDLCLPDREWNPSTGLPGHITHYLQGANCLLAIATRDGQHLDWLNTELREADRLGVESIILKDPELPYTGRALVVDIDRGDLTGTVKQAIDSLSQVLKAREQRSLLGWLVLAGLLFAIFGKRD